MNSMSLPVGIFDLITIGFLTLGVLRGRKQGMSEELLSLMKWLSVVFVCAAAYEPLGQAFVSNTSVFSTLSCYLMAYVAAALLVLDAPDPASALGAGDGVPEEALPLPCTVGDGAAGTVKCFSLSGFDGCV